MRGPSMNIIIDVAKQTFEDFSAREKITFLFWLSENYKDFVEFSVLTEGERKVWNHHYERPARALGYYTEETSGGTK